jgi:hypothetical protein
MARLTAREIQDILQLLEDGIWLIPTLSKSKKVAMRSKIRKQYAWLLGLIDPTAELVVLDLEKRLPDLFPHYPYGFTDRLHELLKKKLGR